MVLPFLIFGLAALGIGGYYYMNRRRGANGITGGANANGMSSADANGISVMGTSGTAIGGNGGITLPGAAGGTAIGGNGAFAYPGYGYGLAGGFTKRPWDNNYGYGLGNVGRGIPPHQHNTDSVNGMSAMAYYVINGGKFRR
jgi:hypothetical protein